MRRLTRVSVLSVLLVAAAVGAAEPPKGPSLPPPPVPAVVPTPVPAADAPILLPDGVELLVSHSAPCLVKVFPENMASVKRRHVAAGRDWTLTGTFVDPKDGGKTTTDDQTFAGPCYVYRVSPRRAGPAVLLVATGVNDGDVQVVHLDCLTPRPPPVPPVPPTPDPKPPEPKPPEPVKSFRVIFVYESADTLTPAAQRVMFGEKVRAYLDAATTPHPVGGKGWRRYDKDVDAANERDPDLKALWGAAKPQVTAVPCVVVSVNRKADILPLPADEDAAVELFKKYAGGK